MLIITGKMLPRGTKAPLKYCGVSFAVNYFTNINFLDAQKPEKGSNWAIDQPTCIKSSSIRNAQVLKKVKQNCLGDC